MAAVMPTAFTKASVKGEKGQKDISRVSIDPSVFFTTLPAEILFEVGASSESLKAKLELEDGTIVETPIYSVVVSAHGRESVTLAATYEGAFPVLGAKFLEDFGLKVDSESGLLEPTRHPGFAYNFEH
jgi:predicted aspartyl protease